MKQSRVPFQGKMSIMTQKRVLLEEETLQLHAKTFKAWMNSYLKQSGIRVIDIQQDLQDGLILISLTELITGTKCSPAKFGKYHLNPTMDIHKIENCAIAISFIKTWIPINIEPKDIADGNLKIILGLIWRFILHFQLLESQRRYKLDSGNNSNTKNPAQPSDSEEKSVTVRSREAKQQLLEWVKSRTQGYEGVNITNFDTSFQDGLAFCALIDSYDSTLLDYKSLDKTDVAGNLAKAFEVAEKQLGIPQLIDVIDMLNVDVEKRPDEQCVVTYVSEFPRAFATPPGAAKISRINPSQNAAGSNTESTVSNSNSSSTGGGDEESDGFVPLGIQFGEIGYMAGVPRGGGHFSVAQVFEHATAVPFSLPQFGNESGLDAQGLPDHWKLQKALSDAEIARLESEKNKLLQELSRLRTRLVGVLVVGVIEARGLMGLNLQGRSNPYCLITVERQREKTRKIRNTLNPKWDAGFKMYVSEPDAVLHITLYNWDRFLSDGFLGKLDIPISDLTDGQQIERWYTLLPRKPGGKVSGEINLRLLYQKEK